MEIYEYGNKDASIVLVQLVDGHMLGAIQEEIELINVRTDADYSLVVFKVDNWNSDLSPWPSPAVLGKDDFAGNAKDTLPEIVDYSKDCNKTYYIGGYSLAGLFALWASYQTDIFEGVAAASPSMSPKTCENCDAAALASAAALMQPRPKSFNLSTAKAPATTPAIF
jgi:hypothetical protein